MKSIRRMTQAELAAYVQTELQKRGITVILSGGAAVSIYSHNKYISRDVDLVNVYLVERKKIRAAMEELGFQETSRYFEHSDSEHIIEFPPGPLAIDNEPVTDLSRVKLATGTLKVISPTDCIKDRLAAFYYWGDQQTLEQAVLVARRRRVKLAELRRWSRSIQMLEKYKVFLERLATKARKRS